MELQTFKKLLSELDEPYYDANVPLVILENFFHKSFPEIKDMINNLNVSVTSDEIRNFLDEKFDEENLEVKNRIIERQNKNYNAYIYEEQITDEWIKDACERFSDDLIAERYNFSPFVLKYFNKYSDIMKKKVLQLLDIIEHIGDKNKKMKDIRKKYDIVLKNKKISKTDIERLALPAIYNIQKLEEKTAQANNLDTYLNFKISPISLGREGILENEIYPNNNLDIPLSERQEKIKANGQMKSRKIIAKALMK